MFPPPARLPLWQLLRQRFQKAIAEGASTSQVTAISVLASIYLQAVIAASMEDVELFLAPLTARSKVREVLRGLVATRQVHTLSLGQAPHYYVAGTLPEFAPPPTIYASASIPASAYFLRSHDEELPEPAAAKQRSSTAPALAAPHKPAEPLTPDAAQACCERKTRNRRGPISAVRPRTPGIANRRNRLPEAVWCGMQAPVLPTGTAPTEKSGRHPAHPLPAHIPPRRPLPPGPQRKGSQRKVHPNGAKTAGKPGATSRKASRPARLVSSRKPAMTASSKAGNGKRFGLAARPRHGTKKRG